MYIYTHVVIGSRHIVIKNPLNKRSTCWIYIYIHIYIYIFLSHSKYHTRPCHNISFLVAGQRLHMPLNLLSIGSLLIVFPVSNS